MTLRWVAGPLPGDVRHLRARAGAAREPRLAGHPMWALRQRNVDMRTSGFLGAVGGPCGAWLGAGLGQGEGGRDGILAERRAA